MDSSLSSYHLLLINSHLIFHFFTVPCLRQHFYPLGILVHNSSSKDDCTTIAFKLLTHRFTTSGFNCFICLAFSFRNLYIQVEVSHTIILQNLRCKQPLTGNWKTANGFACFSFGLFVCLFNTLIIFLGV